MGASHSSDRSARIHGLQYNRAGTGVNLNELREASFNHPRYGHSAHISPKQNTQSAFRDLISSVFGSTLWKTPNRTQPREVQPAEVPSTDTQFPIHKVKGRLQELIKKHDVILLKGETGCGKSVYGPEFLAELGYQVIVLEPRRVIAQSLAARRAEITGTVVGDEVGYQHSLSKAYSDNTKILYVTYGTQYVKELIEKSSKNRIFFVDEAHLESAEMELFLALCQKRGIGGENPKLVIASATIDVKKYQNYFGGNVPLIEVEGRSFPITELTPKDSEISDIIAAVQRGETPLYFVHGKRAIYETIEKLSRMMPALTTIPFHAQLSQAELQRPFQPFSGPTAIIATPIAESGLTLKVNCVISNGLTRRAEIHDGVESLMVRDVSLFELEQQFGRAGRIEDGKATYHGRDKSELSLMPPPEIQNSHIDALYLKAIAGNENFRFLTRYMLNRPYESQVLHAERHLRFLGLITSENRPRATTAGLFAAALPVTPQSGKILYLAKELDVPLKSTKFLDAAINIVAVMEAEGITSKAKQHVKALLGDYGNSEPLAQARLLEILATKSPATWASYGAVEMKVMRALEARATIRKRLGFNDDSFTPNKFNSIEQIQLLECLWRGSIDQVFRQVSRGGAPEYGKYDRDDEPQEGSDKVKYKQLRNREDKKAKISERVFSQETFVSPGRFFVGRPYNIGDIGSYGQDIMHKLILMPSQVPKKWLRDNLPPEFKTSLAEAVEAQNNREEHEQKIIRTKQTHRPYGRRRN